LFAAYDHALKTLATADTVDAVLRRFEYQLLDELGYSFDFQLDGGSGLPVQPTHQYRYEPGVGLVASSGSAENRAGLYGGSDLLAMAAGEFGGTVRVAAKRLLREALAEHLGDAPLRSRELFRAAAALPLQQKSPQRDPVSPAQDNRVSGDPNC
jgi:DNA repair protein RecO (recombination protein O)